MKTFRIFRILLVSTICVQLYFVKIDFKLNDLMNSFIKVYKNVLTSKMNNHLIFIKININAVVYYKLPKFVIYNIRISRIIISVKKTGIFTLQNKLKEY